ncbi:hypothetical protein B4168_2563 [Anoxybacillus flavithermus]|nr:hypothetical protein B4168_2563 [Anoxybacillus flavithermus]OAO85217.1 hypothetical protein GT23_2908 [Parageobacillus thermoglucosidasius]
MHCKKEKRKLGENERLHFPLCQVNRNCRKAAVVFSGNFQDS